MFRAGPIRKVVSSSGFVKRCVPEGSANPVSGNFQLALQSAGSKREVDRTAELKRNEFANCACAVPATVWFDDRRAAKLLPFDGQPTARAIQ